MKIKIPCANIKMVPREQIEANDYNPNNVPKDKMELLKRSIIDNGFCFPIVVIYEKEKDKYVIIDGFHRYSICQQEWLDIGEVPVVVLEHDISKRMAATIQFNKARGMHQADLDAEIVKKLIEQGLNDEEIAQKLGLEVEAVFRYKQLTGILDIFKNVDYSASWEVEDD